jgi:hypothetical protein
MLHAMKLNVKMSQKCSFAEVKCELLNAQHAGNGFFGLQISKIWLSWQVRLEDCLV